jgi:hypothetical protein
MMTLEEIVKEINRFALEFMVGDRATPTLQQYYHICQLYETSLSNRENLQCCMFVIQSDI